MKFIVFCALALLLGGCMVGPNYHPPINCLSEEWQGDGCPEEPLLIRWWEQFNDPLLTHYIELAANYNKDILTAQASISEAIAVRQIVASQLYPQLGVNFYTSRTYFSKNGPVFALGTGEVDTTPVLPFELQIPQLQNIFTLLLNATWNIDLFGKTRRAIESAQAFIGASFENRNDLLIHVIAEVAREYVSLRSAQQKGVLLEKNITLLEEQVRVASNRFEKGLTGRLTLERIEAQLNVLQSTLPSIFTEISQSIYAISVLTGAIPETLLCDLLPIVTLPQITCEIAYGLRSDLLRRRPDVRQAERELAAAVANIGVAVASFYPSFSLSGNIGLQSLQLRNLFEASSRTWSLGSVTQLPLFQGGNLVGNLYLSDSQAAAAGYTYQQRVLTALQEAESAIVAYTQSTERQYYLHEAVMKLEAYSSMVQKRFTGGLVSVDSLIQSNRDVIESEQALLDSQQATLENAIALYLSLGGGWEPFDTICLPKVPHGP